MDPKRMSASDVREKVTNGSALLVCAYDDSKFSEYHLEGAISQTEFKSKTAGMGKDQEIFFYCA